MERERLSNLELSTVYERLDWCGRKFRTNLLRHAYEENLEKRERAREPKKPSHKRSTSETPHKNEETAKNELVL